MDWPLAQRVLDGSPTAWGGYWFIVELFAPHKQTRRGDQEIPEYLYLELDPRSGKARTRLAAAKVGKDYGETGDVQLYLYETTVSIRGASRAREAIMQAADEAIDRWRKDRVFSGTKRTIPLHEREEESLSYALRIFDVDTAFYGVDT
jgi:hypothetical protein